MSKPKTPPTLNELLKWAREAKADYETAKNILSAMVANHAPKPIIENCERMVRHRQESCHTAHYCLYWYRRGVSDGFNKNLKYIRKYPNLTPEERLLYAIFDESGKRRKKPSNAKDGAIS